MNTQEYLPMPLHQGVIGPGTISRHTFAKYPKLPGISLFFGAALLAGCEFHGHDGESTEQVTLGARSKPILTDHGLKFKDLNGNGQVDPYENWTLSVDERVNDLVSKMTLDEKAGMMLIDTLSAGWGGAVEAPADNYINTQQMSRFILRNPVTATPVQSATAGFNGQPVTPLQMGTWTNSIQEMKEASRLGIPAVFKSNARNHIDPDARAGINESAGAFTAFPKEAGLAAASLGTGDTSPVKSFSQVMGTEWKAIGLRGMYGYMADLSTEPRWYRVHETFTEDADLNVSIIKTLVENLQGNPITSDSPVALTMKHFPGGGPQEMGLDPHFSFGKNQIYPGGNFAYHLKPFMAAIDAGVSSIMPYYGVPINVTYEGVTYDQVGLAFSKQIVTDLLRGKLGFAGYVNSDTGIITDRAWGLESKTVPERVAAGINAGIDVLSGFHDKQTIVDLVHTGLVSQARVDEAVKRLLKEQFQLGLFENPYVDAAKASEIIGSDANRAVALDIQRKSVVLLQNLDQAAAGTKVLPLRPGTKVYILGDYTKAKVEKYGYIVTDGNVKVDGVRPSATNHDYALISVTALVNSAVTTTYKSDDAATGLNPNIINPLTGKSFGAQDRCVATTEYADPVKTCLDSGLLYGGAFPWEVNNLSFTTMAASQSWQIKPSLDEIKAVMNEVGAKNTILAIYFRQPFVLDDASGLKNAGAIVAHFSVSDTALLDVLSGKFKPQGKLPFALANNLQAVIDNEPDVPGYPAKDTLYPFGFGLSY